MASFIQPSFSKGEISPDLYGRVDTALYATGLRTARNVIIRSFGGVSSRPGLQYVGPVKDHNSAIRLKRFEFSVSDSYILEFGNLYLRFLREGSHVLEANLNIAGATRANPCVVTVLGHPFSNGQEINISGITGMTRLNGRRFVIQGAGPNTFQLTDQATGANIDSTGYEAYISGGVAARVYTIVTPYQSADLFRLKFTQSADVMTITHKLYPVMELTRTGHTAWTLTEPTFAPQQPFPAGVAVTVNSAGAVTERYAVTAVSGNATSGNSFEESLQGTKSTGFNITVATQANPCVITIAGHNFLAGDEVNISGVVGMTQLNGRRFVAQGITANTIELTDQATGANIDSTGYTAYSSGGTALQCFVRITNGAVTRNNTISWTASPGALRYSVYRDSNGIFGFLGETELTSFKDTDLPINASISPPHARNPFLLPGDAPGAVSYFEQRRVFGGSVNNPDTSYYSRVASPYNMTNSFPFQADDAITATLASDNVNEIRHFVPGNDLIVFTSGGEWRINAGIDSIFEAATIKQKPQSRWGSSHIPPIVSANTTLFVRPGNTSIRSFGYSSSLDGYVGADILLWSSHLLEKYPMVDWAYAGFVDPIVVGVRSDGAAIVLTYSQEQEVLAWSRWDTLGAFESVASMRVGGDTSDEHLFAVVKRRINGVYVKYIESLHSHNITDPRDCFFVDSGLSLDDPRAITNASSTSPVTITSTAHGFQNGDEVDIHDITWEGVFDADDGETQPDQLNTRRFTVAGATANTFQLSGADGTLFLPYVSGGTARKAVSTISGLDHLEGRVVQVLADGNVISDVPVVNGGFTLVTKASRVHAGLKYIAEIETLDIESSQGTIQGKRKKIAKAVVRFRQSRGLFIGPDAKSLTEVKQREFERLGDPTALFSGDKEIIFTPAWGTNGRIFIRQKYPLPMTVLALIPDVMVEE